MEARYRFMKDNDGHTYLIPVGQEKAFRTWVEACMDEDGNDVGPQFDGWKLDGDPARFTFTDPQLQEEE
jgi:hypothetical protein